jgi:hypothetical protein
MSREKTAVRDDLLQLSQIRRVAEREPAANPLPEPMWDAAVAFFR